MVSIGSIICTLVLAITITLGILFGFYVIFLSTIPQINPIVKHRNEMREAIAFDTVTIGELIDNAKRHIPPVAGIIDIEKSLSAYFKSNEEILKSTENLQELLCVTIVDGSPKQYNQLINKLTSIGSNGCHWVIFAHSTNRPLATQYNSTIYSLNLPSKSKIVAYIYDLSRFDILEINSFIPDYPYNIPSTPTTMFLLELIPILHSYEYVWFNDASISIDHFNISEILTTIRCSFYPPSIVSQPLIYESTTDIEYLHMKSWSNIKEGIAYQTKYIPLYTPIFQGHFLKWFLSFVVVRLLQPIHVLGTDHGIDELICQAAGFYTKRMIQFDRVLHSRDLTLAPCSVVVRGPSVHQTIETTSNVFGIHSMAYRFLELESLRVIKRVFPKFYLPSQSFLANPLSIDSELEVARDIHEYCKPKIEKSSEDRDAGEISRLSGGGSFDIFSFT